MRQKVLDAFALDPFIRDVDVGFFDGGTGADLPNWMDYTRTFPTGPFNVYTRAASGGGTLSSTLSAVTSGVGTTTRPLPTSALSHSPTPAAGSPMPGCPCGTPMGISCALDLAGLATLRLTAGLAAAATITF